mgnify:FL=1
MFVAVNASEKDKNDFMNELTILKNVGQHPNVVCLVGSCNIGGSVFFIILDCLFPNKSHGNKIQIKVIPSEPYYIT